MNTHNSLALDQQPSSRGTYNLRRALGICAAFVGLASFPCAALAIISDGSAAVDVLGQYDESLMTNPQPLYTTSGGNNQPNRRGLGLPLGAAVDTVHHRLFIADSGNNRVLVYNLDSSDLLLDKTADYVLGQPDFRSGGVGTTQSKMSSPQSIAYDSVGDRLFVADLSNNRILVFDTATITNGENAVNVLGQTLFTTASSARTQAGLTSPRGITYDSINQRLFVADSSNNRILVFNVTSITDGQNAVNVLGQNGYTTATGATTQSGLSGPFGAEYDNTHGRLFVADSSNQRVTVYDVNAITNGENAVNVLGQPNFTTATAALTGSGMSAPRAIAYDSANQRLFVLNTGHHRVLVFDVASITDGENATGVLGQTDFTTATAAITQAGLNTPRGIAYDSVSQRLYIGSSVVNRFTVYDVNAVTNGENAVDEIGEYDDSVSDPQPVYTKNGSNDAPSRYGISLTGAVGAQAIAVDTTHHRLFFADTVNHRILVYNLTTGNLLADRLPDFVLGQSNFYTATAANTQSAIQSPQSLAYDSTNNRLFAVSAVGNRVLVFNVASITNGQNAVNVLGQTDFTTITSGTTQAKLSAPSGITYDNTNNRLFVADPGNHRVLVFSVASITDGQPAVNVLGQNGYTTATGATTQSGLRTPAGLTYDGSARLFVADGGNNRILVFNVASITNGQNAVNVLGQTTFTASGAATTQAGLRAPRGTDYDSANSRLFVSDFSNNRVLVFNVASITDGQPAVNVLGQSLFTTTTSAQTQTNLSLARGIAYEPTTGYLYVTDNQRVIVFDAALTSLSSSSSSSSSSSAEPVAQGSGGHRGSGVQTYHYTTPSTGQSASSSSKIGQNNQTFVSTGNILIDGTIKRLEQRIAKMLQLNPKSVFAKALLKRIDALRARVMGH